MLSLERIRELLSYDPETGIFRWRVFRGGCVAGSIAGSMTDQGYHHVMIDGKNYKSHRLAWFYVNGEWPSADLDHEDTRRVNNKIKNLRPASRSQNNVNSAVVRASSGFRGVYYQRNTAKWRAKAGKRHVGYYDTKEEAHAAYLSSIKEQYGEFARTD